MPSQKYDIENKNLDDFDLKLFISQYGNTSPNDFILYEKKTFSIPKNILATQLS